MRRHVLMVDLKDDPDAIAAYRQHHERVWPEVMASLRRAGIQQMEIYLLGRRAVMIVETDGRDLSRCFAAHRASGPRVAEWETLMANLQETPPGGAAGEWWSAMVPVFSLEEQAAEARAERSERRSASGVK